MSELDEETERKVLRSIRLRNMLKAVAIAVPVFVLGRLMIHWLGTRFHVGHVAAGSWSLLMIFVGAGIVLPSSKWDRAHDRRETPRLRLLQNEWHDRLQWRLRFVWIAVISALLLLELVTLLISPNWSSPEDSSELVIILIVASGASFMGRFPKIMGETTRAHYLAATQRAYAVTMVSCVSMVLLDNSWSGRLRSTITISLLAGVLTQQISLACLEPRVVPGKD